jgi:hypothetical protein
MEVTLIDAPAVESSPAPPIRPRYTYGGPTDQPPAIPSAKTLERMVRVIGREALDAYTHAISVLDNAFDFHSAALTTGRDLLEHLKVVNDVTHRRNAYAGIVDLLAKRLKQSKFNIPPARSLPDLARLLAKSHEQDFARQNAIVVKEATAEHAAAKAQVEAIGGLVDDPE